MNSGSRTEKSSRKSSSVLGKRDRAILDDVVHYRLITNDWVLARHLTGAKPNAAVKVTGRLCRDGWLEGHSFTRRKRYFTAGTRLVKQRGLPLARTRPLGTQSLAMRIAVLRYCLSGEKGSSASQRFTLSSQDEMRVAFPWLPPTILHKANVLSGDETHRTWRILRVDLGGRPDHVVRKCVGDLTPLAECPEFPQLLAERRFIYVFLTASRHKKRTIEQALADRPWPSGIQFQIGLVCELAELIATS